ncbi:MAG: hypothetical protein M5U31_01240 [Acidimicrobiia bacterium]|nr:hypothetical protein [Acidimicrobiia bacterium]
MDDRNSLHAVTWLVWAIAAGTTVQLAPSPVYVVVVILLSALVVQVHGRDSALARAFPAFLALGASFAVIRIVLTMLTAHGAGRALFTLPEFTLPRLVGGFTVGGSVESEVILQSAAEGFAIVGLIAAFGAFNAVVSHYELVQAAPRSFYEPGLIVTVALAFAPSTVTAVHDVRLADARAPEGVRCDGGAGCATHCRFSRPGWNVLYTSRSPWTRAALPASNRHAPTTWRPGAGSALF